MPLSSVEGRRCSLGNDLRGSLISPTTPIQCTSALLLPTSLLIPPSSCIDSCLLDFHPLFAPPFRPHLPCWCPFLNHLFSLFFHLLAEPFCSCPHPSRSFPSLFTSPPPLCLSAPPHIFSRSSHSFSPISLSYTLGYTRVKEVLTLFVCREQDYLKLFPKFLNSRCSGRSLDSFPEVVKWSWEWSETVPLQISYLKGLRIETGYQTVTILKNVSTYKLWCPSEVLFHSHSSQILLLCLSVFLCFAIFMIIDSHWFISFIFISVCI